MLEKEVDYCSGSYGSEGEDGEEGVFFPANKITENAQIRKKLYHFISVHIYMCI